MIDRRLSKEVIYMDKFNELRNLYPNLVYKSYEIKRVEEEIIITYNFEIENLQEFKPTISIPNNIINTNVDEEFLSMLVFNLGMVELISYFKATCSKNIIIKAGFLDKEQIEFFSKLYYLGLQEFLYINKIEVSEKDLLNFIVEVEEKKPKSIEYEGHGNLVPVGGGKDSCVTMEILKDMDNTCFVINPKKANIECIKESKNKSIYVKRVIDKNLLKLNTEGFLNGHTPFSSIVAFTSFIVAYLSGKKYIVLSNEGSANEATVLGTNVNHQYSKTYEFERDFNAYTKKYFGIDICYFSFLRPLSEFQIGMIFASLKKYHKVFKSCNVGSKSANWDWCCNCPKCLFVYITLSAFLSKEELIDIFGEDLYANENLLETFKELLGFKEEKPFECVGTYEECRYAVSLAIKKTKELPYLLKYYKDNYDLDFSFKNEYNTENNLPLEFEERLKEELKKYDR